MRRNISGQFVGAQMITAADGTAFTGAVTVSVTGDAGVQATGSVGSGACTHEGNGFHTYAPAQAETNYTHVAFTFTGTGAIPVTVQIYTISYDASGRLDVGALGGDAQSLTDLKDFADAGYDPATNKVQGVVLTDTVTNLTNLPAITANWLTAAGIAAGALDGKGNWNIGKTGYSLTATTGLGNQTADITGNLSGSVGSVTAGVTVTTNNDKTGYALSATGSAAMTEGYAALGAAATLPQLLYEVRALLAEKSIGATTLTTKKLDGLTTAATYTLDDATTPSSITRAT